MPDLAAFSWPSWPTLTGVGLLLVQLAVVLTACRLAGSLARRLGQPAVIGEIAAGIALGPSLLGALAPGLADWLFPKSGLGVLYGLGQLGLVLYLFVVGLELDFGRVRDHARRGLAVSAAGLVLPAALGAALAWHWRGRADLFPPGTPTLAAVLFLGAAMAITAMPVLTRIVKERGLLHHPVGLLALTAGSLDDVAAWCLLALALALTAGSAGSAALTAALAALFAFAVLGPGRPLLARLVTGASGPARALVLLFLAAGATELIGVHSIFGAFVLGLAMPRGEAAERARAAVEPLTLALLLPLFFTYSGLSTRLDLLAAPALLGVALAVLVAACVGKGLGCYVAARASGLPASVALGVGALMNARGLVELIVLNVGLAAGLITPGLFAVMVVMALATTLLAGPVLTLALRGERSPDGPVASG